MRSNMLATGLWVRRSISARIIAGIMPRIPPPSIESTLIGVGIVFSLSTVTWAAAHTILLHSTLAILCELYIQTRAMHLRNSKHLASEQRFQGCGAILKAGRCDLLRPDMCLRLGPRMLVRGLTRIMRGGVFTAANALGCSGVAGCAEVDVAGCGGAGTGLRREAVPRARVQGLRYPHDYFLC